MIDIYKNASMISDAEKRREEIMLFQFVHLELPILHQFDVFLESTYVVHLVLLYIEADKSEAS